MEDSEIQNFYKNQTIFLTGGTGFLGKVLIEKLLRVCWDLKKIYIMVRPKRDKTADARFREIFNFPCFDGLRKQNPNFGEKIQLIEGNCDKPYLDLSENNREILKKEVNIVIHLAANVKFDQELRSASYINIQAVKNMLDLAKEMSSLKVFVHISTAYSNSPQAYIKEKFYEPPMKAKDLFNLLDVIDDETLTAATPTLIKNWPNTYTFTKAIAEDVIRTEGQTLPIIMIRPAIIVSCVEEPLPGWVDNLYGLIGITSGMYLGVIKCLRLVYTAPLHCIPCDYVANHVLAAIWDFDKERATAKNNEIPDNNIPIYNYVGSQKNLQLMRDLERVARTLKWKLPLNGMIWYPITSFTESTYWYNIRVFFLQTCVSYVIDFILICLGKKPMAVKKYAKVTKLVNLICYFTSSTWCIENNNVEKLWHRMKETEKKLFKFNMDDLDWDNFWETSLKYGRIYLFNESIDDIPKAKVKLYLFTILNNVVFILFLYFIYKLIMFILVLF